MAPIALYPDALVAQVLGAATFPDQVAFASDWLQQNSNLTGSALMKSVDQQPWDPSVKALTQFPSVLQNLAKNLSWTSSLGEAYHTQAAEVMSAVQDVARKSKGCRKSEIGLADYGCAAVTASDRDSAHESAGSLRPAVQSHGCLWNTYATPGYSASSGGCDRLLAFGAGIAVGA